MKLVFITLLTTSVLSAPVLANNEGHRVGIGFNKTSIEQVLSPSIDYSTSGFKLEYGYEFNHIVGVNISYNKGSGDFLPFIDSNNSTFKIDTDIGYTFNFDGFSIKPYGVIGWAKFDEELSVVGENLGSWDDSSLFIGTGVRGTFNENFYADFRADFINLKDEGDDIFVDQFSFTVGYKF
ncbi:porin family protein [Vibrio sp. TBV020]|uniref:porin family protein n=1 Tax=Vibrio sp. TBV020 TaxID=3137398 RepID=UPI0038CDC913